MSGNDFPRRTKRCKSAIKRLWEQYGERLDMSEDELNQLRGWTGNLVSALREKGLLKVHKGLRQAAEEADEECRENV